MSFAATTRITDICLLVQDIAATVDFYTSKLGYELRRRAEGFADFHANGVTLAAWEIGHIHANTGVSGLVGPKLAHKACVAVELEDPSLVDKHYAELLAKGVDFYAPPADYVWNARCVYFYDPDGTLWELYAWLGGGPGDYHTVT